MLRIATWCGVMVHTFSYHLGLLMLLISLVAGVRRRLRLSFAAAVLGALSAGPSLRTFLPQAAEAVNDVPRPCLRVMAVNLFAYNAEPQALIEEIRSANADVLFLPEYTHRWHDLLSAAIGDAYPHRLFALREDPFAIGLYSRHALVGPAEAHLSLGGVRLPNIRAEIDLAGRRTALYCIHLAPAKLPIYASTQMRQFAGLTDLLRRERLPAIVAGDFNFTEHSPFASRLRAIDFADAYDQAGYARGDTWPVLHVWQRLLPGIRIDHIYLRGGWRCVRAETGEGRGSDHRPVVADLVWGD